MIDPPAEDVFQAIQEAKEAGIISSDDYRRPPCHS